MELQLKKEDYDLKVEDENVTITLKNKGFKKPLKDLIEDMIKKFTKIKKVEWKEALAKKEESSEKK